MNGDHLVESRLWFVSPVRKAGACSFSVANLGEPFLIRLPSHFSIICLCTVEEWHIGNLFASVFQEIGCLFTAFLYM